MENIKQLVNKGLPKAKAFSKAVVKAAESTCIEADPAKSGWFAAARSILEPLIEARNKASELLKEHSPRLGHERASLQEAATRPVLVET
jgi:hypothetical protein